MNTTLSSLAISAALESSWQKAIELNEQILKENPEDTEALNRIAYANYGLGKIQKAQQFYKKVLQLDPCNTIASKNIRRIKGFDLAPKRKTTSLQKTISLSNLFLEEPGKTKVINLVKLGTKGVLSRLRPGDVLLLLPKKHFISVSDSDNNYVGSLPDDISFRLLDFIKKGNKYEAFARSIDKNSVLVFIKEVCKSGKLKNVPSFATKLEVKNEGKNSRSEREEESVGAEKEEVPEEE